jgi:hypothetical protein
VPVVAIGASAGGLEALLELLSALSFDTGTAFIYIQHLDPTHQSQLIGLALCKIIVGNHNGLIYAVDKEDEGATFHVILPLAQEKAH